MATDRATRIDKAEDALLALGADLRAVRVQLVGVKNAIGAELGEDQLGVSLDLVDKLLGQLQSALVDLDDAAAKEEARSDASGGRAR